MNCIRLFKHTLDFDTAGLISAVAYCGESGMVGGPYPLCVSHFFHS